MHAVSTNHIADILHFNDNNKYLATIKYSRTTSYFHFFIVCIFAPYAFYLVTVKLWSDF